MVRLSQFRDIGVDLAWHEAVALVLETIDRFVPAGSRAAPALSDLTLSRDGTLELLELASRRVAPVPQLAGNVRELLGAAALPPELNAQIEQWSAAEGNAAGDVEQVRSGLTYFERPDRAAVLAALGERADNAQAAVRASKQLEELTARARESDQARPPSAKPRPKADRQRVRKAIPIVVALLALGALAAAIPYLWRVAGAAPGQPSYAQRAVQQVGSTIKSGVDSLLGSEKKETPPAVEQPASPSEKPAARGPRRRTRKDDLADRPVLILVEDLPNQNAPPNGEASGEPTAPQPEDAPGPADATAVFEETDPSLEPPQLLRPALPSEPAANIPEDQIGTLDLLIGPDGRVERVRLESPSNRFQERMLVSAVKAWVFTPAMKDGRPVRCRARIRVTI